MVFFHQANLPTHISLMRFLAMNVFTDKLRLQQGRGSKKPEIATVIAPYSATSSEQLSLQRGQLIMIRKKSASGWWEGELQVLQCYF
jgi:hypothetical protein